MFSAVQCYAARLLTGTDTPDEIISQEYAALLGPNRNVAAMLLDDAVRKQGLPFQQAWDFCKDDFQAIAEQYSVSPATMVCLYMEWAGGGSLR
ncbi:MAG: hypothetical protein E7425_05295 [Ruminococcaceae bacterium]|jgi:hypothetical protein|nr:hypothetical protein [Oscillospiraceae bacterium]